MLDRLGRARRTGQDPSHRACATGGRDAWHPPAPVPAACDGEAALAQAAPPVPAEFVVPILRLAGKQPWGVDSKSRAPSARATRQPPPPPQDAALPTLWMPNPSEHLTWGFRTQRNDSGSAGLHRDSQRNLRSRPTKPIQNPLTRRSRERPAQEPADPPQAPLLSLACRSARHSYPRIADPRGIIRMEKAHRFNLRLRLVSRG